MTTEADDIHLAEIDRSLALVSQVWEEENLSVDEVCKLLDGIGDIVTQTCTFNEFVTTSNLNGQERLN